MRFSWSALLLTAFSFMGCSDYDLKSTVDQNETEDTATMDAIADTAVVEQPPEPGDPTEEGQPPVAICEVSPNPVSPPFESATWNGSGSYDPDGGVITSYHWEIISQPDGAGATLTNNDAPVVSGFMPDLAGDYVGQLTVTNEAGLTGSCETTLEAIPAENLWVEMYWEHSGDDMDLHLIAPGKDWNTYKADYQWDCYYANCAGGWSSLDWGTSGMTDDDPNLDLDDISGTGPENINVLSPETSGSYTVVVHDYPGSVYSGANNVTVNIYLNGTLTWSDTRAISVEDSYTPFAMVDWGNGVIIPM